MHFPWLLQKKRMNFKLQATENGNGILKAKLCYFYKFKLVLPIGVF